VRALPEFPAAWHTYANGLWGHRLSFSFIGASQDAGFLAPSSQRVILERIVFNQACLHWPSEPILRDQSLNWARLAHACAHLAFGSLAQSRGSFKPIQLALYGVLEDARVEALACELLPGLRSLWRPFHEGAYAMEGMNFEALLARLSRSLLDPEHQDPHAWIRKVKQMFWALDLRDSASLRGMVSILGNDIGQMRLPFNDVTYRVQAPYRDDNSHLWAHDEALANSSVDLQRSTDPPQETSPTSSSTEEKSARETQPKMHPEWDYRIGQYRKNWCAVYEEPIKTVATTSLAYCELHDMYPSLLKQWQQRVLAISQTHQVNHRLEEWGDRLSDSAMVDASIDRRAGRAPSHFLYKNIQKKRRNLNCLVLLDLSASNHGPLLSRSLIATRACVEALKQAGHSSAVWGFRSWGRQDVEVTWIKNWTEENSMILMNRLAKTQSGGSTRLGAITRHAGLYLSTYRRLQNAKLDLANAPCIILLSDGQAFDIDVYDSRYLKRDFVQAQSELRHQGILWFQHIIT